MTWHRVFGRGDAPPPAEALAAGAAFGLERYTADEAGIRAELQGWAAYLETCAGGEPLMERMIQTRQLFTLHGDGAEGVCRALAAATDGVYQVDGAGFFAADGALLVRE